MCVVVIDDILAALSVISGTEINFKFRNNVKQQART